MLGLSTQLMGLALAERAQPPQLIQILAEGVGVVFMLRR